MQFPVMLLTSNDYRQSETEKEPHNLLLDFRGEWGPPGSDAGLRLNAQLPYPVGPPLAPPQTKQRPDQSLKPYSAALLDDVEDIEGAPADYKYLPHKLLEALDALEPELGPDFAHYHSGGCLGAVTLQRTVYLVWPHCGGLLQFWSPTGEGFSVGGLPPDPVLGLEAYSSPKECWIVLRAKLQVLVLSVAEPRAYRVAYSECSRAPFLDAQLQGQLLGLVQLGKGFSLKDIGGPRVAFRLAASEVRKFAFAPPNRVVLMEPWLVTVHDFAEKTLLQRFDPQLMACNQLCNLRMAGGNLLLATRHYLLAAPLDCLEGFGAFAHGLSSAPLHLEALGPLVCLGGRWGAVAFVEGTPFGLPCPLPSLKDSLEAALPGTRDVSLHATLLRRLDWATAGLKLVEDVLFSVNSIGELFQQRLSHSAVDNATPIRALIGWVGAFRAQLPPPRVPVTNFAAMGGAYGRLAAPPQPAKRGRRRRSLAGRFLARFQPLYGRKRITSEFGRGFLDAWTDEESDASGASEPELPFYDKVSSWMERHDAELPAPD
uniref:Uncharacterized protein n=1 Tax=Dendroctonus ponderosae TaxID=77166 RepID=A0AAR5PSA6_DENPD